MNEQNLSQEEIRGRVRAEELQRLSLQLHDGVGQVLVLAKLQLTRIQESLKQPPDADTRAWLEGILASLISEIDTALHMIESETFNLHAAGLTEVGLVATLEKECADFTHRTGIPCEGRFEPVPLDAKAGETIVFIVREALCNIARHSGAMHARTTLQRSWDRAVLVIRDNGTGIDPSRIRAPESLGLRGIEARAKALAGELTIDSTPNEGMELKVSFPLPHPPAQKNTSLLD